MREVERRIGVGSAAALVVASMIGTGIFTSTGFQVRDVANGPAILFAWLIGGVTALCGALSYAELATALPKNGGEYALLSRIYHPAAGFVVGFMSLIVGFGAPTAAMALAFGEYLRAIFPATPATPAALAAILALAVVHSRAVERGMRAQDLLTGGKLLLVLGFVGAGLFAGEPARVAQAMGKGFGDAVLSPSFAIALIYVAFTYSGWNAAAYVAGEVADPARSLPRALLLGTLAVTAVYAAMNLVLLSSAPPEALAGKVEIAHVAAVAMFGEDAARVVSAVIAAGLLSSIGAMIATGARVAEAIGREHPRLSFLALRRPSGAPVVAVLFQSALAVALVLSASFDVLLEYTGFTISLGLFATVIGVIVLRLREPALPRPYRVWAYPLPPLLYGALSLWMVVGAIVARPAVALAGLLTVAVGLGVYRVTRAPASP